MSTISASTTSTTAYKVTADTTGTLVFQTGASPTTALAIDTTQQTGFGTASPTARVTLSGTGAAVAQDFTNTTASTGRRYRVVSGDNGNAYITDMTGSADVLSIGSSGNTIALQGGSISAGTGIAFPATQVASSNANTLDDYEEGTWTPTLGGTATYSSQVGEYVKVGKQVTVWFDIIVSSIGTGNTSFVSGLPFVAGGNAQGKSGGVGYFASLALSVMFITGRVDVGSSGIQYGGLTATSPNMSSGLAIFGNSARLVATISYTV